MFAKCCLLFFLARPEVPVKKPQKKVDPVLATSWSKSFTNPVVNPYSPRVSNIDGNVEDEEGVLPRKLQEKLDKRVREWLQDLPENPTQLPSPYLDEIKLPFAECAIPLNGARF